MTDPQPACTSVICRLSRRNWPLLPYRPILLTTVQPGDTHASFLAETASPVVQFHHEEELSKKAKWVQ